MGQALIALLLGGFTFIIGGLSGGGSSDSEDGQADTTSDPSRPGGDGATGDPVVDGAPDDPVGTIDAVINGTVVPVSAPVSASGIPDLPDSAHDIGWGGLNAEEQLIVELINRARMDPAGEATRLSDPLAPGVSPTPSEPLAVTPELSAASRAHSEDMHDRSFFSHTNPDGQSPGARALEEGHGTGYVGENIGWIGASFLPADTQPRTEAHHENLWNSDGHQSNLMNDRWSEIGVGYDEGTYNGWNGSTFVTEMFSDRGYTYLTGVVIDDGDGDDFYDIGEGAGGVHVTAWDGTTAYATETWGAGGYSLPLPGGTYDVLFEGGGLDAPVVRTVTIGDENLKLDVIEDSGVATVVSGLSEPASEPAASAVLDFIPTVPMDEGPASEEEEDADWAELVPF